MKNKKRTGCKPSAEGGEGLVTWVPENYFLHLLRYFCSNNPKKKRKNLIEINIIKQRTSLIDHN